MSKLFTPVTFGPLTLRNRTIRSAAFESMCPGNAPSQMLLDYHRSVAAGGVGMTTVAYAAVTQSGLSFDRQLWMRPEIIPGLKKTDRCCTCRRCCCGYTVGTLWQYVAQKHLWCYSCRSFQRFQSLLTYFCSWLEERGTA